jgi:hypothetical protein
MNATAVDGGRRLPSLASNWKVQRPPTSAVPIVCSWKTFDSTRLPVAWSRLL